MFLTDIKCQVFTVNSTSAYLTKLKLSATEKRRNIKKLQNQIEAATA